MDGLLAELPAGSLDEWWQYYQLQPWGDDWERTSLLSAQLTNVILAMAGAFGKDQSAEPLELDAFVPWRHADTQRAERRQELAALDRMEGL